MSAVLPSFIYPAAESTGQSYFYNYDDNVNVSWCWDGPPGASVGIVVWIDDPSERFFSRWNWTSYTSQSGSFLCPLNFSDVQYPANGHFNLWAHFKDGTSAEGPNSGDMLVSKNETVGWQCHNCTNQPASPITSILITSTLPTETSTRNNTTTQVQPPDSPIQSAQPTPPGSDLSGGAITGIVIGAVVGVAIACVLASFYQRRRMRRIRTHKAEPTEGLYGGRKEVHGPGRRAEHYEKAEHAGAELHELHEGAGLHELHSGADLYELHHGENLHELHNSARVPKKATRVTSR